jgi:integrase
MASEGILYQRTPNSKYYYIYNTGEKVIKNGKEVYKQKWIDLGTKDKKTAEVQVKLIKADLIKKGRYDEPSKETFAEWLEFWLEKIVRPNNKKGEPLKDKTYDDYEYIIRFHIIPKLGHLQLKKITPQILQEFYIEKRKEYKLGHKTDSNGNRLPSDKLLSTRTLQKIQMIIRASLKKAVIMYKIPENPDLRLDRVKYKAPPAKYLTSDQVIDFLENAKKDRWLTFKQYVSIFTSLGSGLREGEICALKFEDIDFKKRKIKVDESLSTVRTHAKEGKKQKVIIQTTKSFKSDRIVTVPKDVIAHLRLLKYLHKKEFGHLNLSDFIFCNQNKEPYNPKKLADLFINLANRLGYKGITFHKLRHSYATMLLEKGEHTRVIQENLGHARDEITQIYAHVIESMKESAATKLEGFSKKK